MRRLLRLPGARLVTHAVLVLLVFVAMVWVNNSVDPLMDYYIALVAMYATAMFGMVILVGLSGQVSLGNGALMAVGGYLFALTSMNWQTVPLIGVPMNGVWAMLFAAVGGVVFGLLIGGLAARLQGPYLAGLTLGIAVGIPAIANRFPDLLGGESGLELTVPYPDGGYAPVTQDFDQQYTEVLPSDQAPLPSDGASLGAGDLLTSDNFPSTGASSFPSDGASAFPSDGSTAMPSVAPSDLLTADNFPSAGPSASAGDLLTPDNFPSAGASPLPDVSVVDPSVVDPNSVDPNSIDYGFVLERWQATLAVAVACIVAFVALNLVRGRQGRVWRAVRDDPVAAAVSGISPAGSKVSAFMISSLFASLAGAVFAQILSYVGPGAFGLGLSLSLLVGVVLGGRASLVGALIGAVLLVWLPEFVHNLSDDRGWSDQITNNAPNLIYGLLVVLVVLVAPGGIVGTLQALVGRVTNRALK
jgi:ABC-type branched-subunit amino acid transport system permease subunit